MSSNVLKAVKKGIPFSCAPLQFSVLCLCPKLRRSKDLNFAGRTRAQSPCALEKSTFFQSRQRAHLLVSRLPARLCTLLHVWLTRQSMDTFLLGNLAAAHLLAIVCSLCQEIEALSWMFRRPKGRCDLSATYQGTCGAAGCQRLSRTLKPRLSEAFCIKYMNI